MAGSAFSTGRPGPGGPRPGSGRKQQDFASISYNGQHRRYRRLYGPASGYLCAGCCGSRADSWARIHGRGGLVLFVDIAPLCWSCHASYDRQTRIDGAATRYGHTPEMRESARRHFSQGHSQRAIARMVGIDRATVSKWVI